MLDREQVKKVANLARLEITPDEEKQFLTQLSTILEYFEQLSELDTDEVPPTTRAIDMSNVTRPDELETLSDRASLLSQAPSEEDGFFRVPQILSSTEG